MQNPMLEINQILDSIYVNEIISLQEGEQKLTEKVELYSMVSSLFYIIAFPLFLYHSYTQSYLSIFVITFLSLAAWTPTIETIMKFILGGKRDNMDRKLQLEEIEKDAETLINKDFIFKLFTLLDKTQPFLLKKSKINSLKKKIEKLFLKKEYALIIKQLVEFKQNSYDDINNDIQLIIDQEDLTKQYRKYKKEENTENETFHEKEMNGELDKKINQSL